MSNEINLQQLVELVGIENVVNLLKEAGKKSGEAKDWGQVSKISNFIETLQSEAKTWQSRV